MPYIPGMCISKPTKEVYRYYENYVHAQIINDSVNRLPSTVFSHRQASPITIAPTRHPSPSDLLPQCYPLFAGQPRQPLKLRILYDHGEGPEEDFAGKSMTREGFITEMVLHCR